MVISKSSCADDIFQFHPSKTPAFSARGTDAGLYSRTRQDVEIFTAHFLFRWKDFQFGSRLKDKEIDNLSIPNGGSIYREKTTYGMLS